MAYYLIVVSSNEMASRDNLKISSVLYISPYSQHRQFVSVYRKQKHVQTNIRKIWISESTRNELNKGDYH